MTAPQKPSDILREAKRLIKKGWTRGAWARIGKDATHSSDPAATCFCASGALFRVSAGDLRRVASDYLRRGARLRTSEIPKWNDAPGRKKSQVLAAFDKAIQLAEADSQ